MADSDSDYIQDQDVDADNSRAPPSSNQTRSSTRRTHALNTHASPKSTSRAGAAGGWEVTRTWEDVVEGADGTIRGTVEGLLEGEKRRRLLKDTTPLQRGIIRHLLLVLDLSSAMVEKDLRPTRYLLTIRYACEFVAEFFEQNPISQLGIIGMRDGLAVRVSDVSGNPAEHIEKLQALRTREPKGQPSLQNALEMARGALFHAPTHTTREVLLVFGSLLSSDPGDIHTTIAALVSARISVRVIGLAAQVALCTTLVARTNPHVNPTAMYSVVLNEQHYRELFMQATTPPPASHNTAATPLLNGDATANGDPPDPCASTSSSLLMMGFPSRIVDQHPTLCACHSQPVRGGYCCSRCATKVCSLPTTCPACGLTLILSTHLARSYHHLFPLQNWTEVSWREAGASKQRACFGCMYTFPRLPRDYLASRHDTSPSLRGAQKRRSQGSRRAEGREDARDAGAAAAAAAAAAPAVGKGGVSESQRYACRSCKRHFCIECDVFCHEVVHNCPGCQAGAEGVAQRSLST